MDGFTKEELEKAIPTIASMIRRSEKVQPKFKEGTPQATLTRNRVKALYISSSLISRELGDSLEDNFSKEDLEKAIPPITSTISKCEKAQEKLKEGTPQLSLTKNMIKSLYISLSLITKELIKP
ncbi:hypothetical protein [Sedimentibacter sp. B4]|uniref:hypothetical protein n=1 Tax=Sedimentibacter sp. B4 TaxID=304766 RepID=UPI000312FB5D|nr:hypothetical protein [Sedimentibacter sp. B4]